MSKIVWDAVGEHLYETGVDHGVLYLYNQTSKAYDTGVAWNGLTSVSEKPSGAESNAKYADNIKYLNLYSAEEFGATIECFTYPDEFELCDGSAAPVTGMSIHQQSRSMFGLSYRTKVGNDVTDDLGYKLHLIYGCKASPSERQYQTVNDSPEALSFSYEITTTAVAVAGYKPTSIITIDSTKFSTNEARAKLANLEAVLYGTNASEGHDAVYTADTAATFDPTKEYYTLDGSTYTKYEIFEEFSGTAFETDVTYYERSGSEGSYVYTPTSDETYQDSKTYYTVKDKEVSVTYYLLTSPAVPASEGTTPRLPMPDEVISILSANG